MNYNVLSKESFDIVYDNKCPKVVILGLSPGRNQSFRLLNKSKNLTNKERNKIFAFRGKAIQSNLEKMLKAIGVFDVLYSNTVDDFRDVNNDEVYMTSLLPYATMKSDIAKQEVNYSDIAKTSYSGKIKYISGITYEDIVSNEVLLHNFNVTLNQLKKYDEDTIFVLCGASVRDVFSQVPEFKKFKYVLTICHPSFNNNARVETFVSKACLNKQDESHIHALEYREECDKVMSSFFKKHNK